VEYRNEVGRFVVRLPSWPTEDKPAGKGDGKVTEDKQPARKSLAKVTLPQQSGEYAVAWQDLAAGQVTTVEAQLDASRRELNGTEVSRRPVLLQGKYQGQEMVVDWTKGRVKGRVFIVGSRIYTLVVSGAPWWVESAAADTFLDSFTVLEE
jgi:hypothetical protein